MPKIIITSGVKRAAPRAKASGNQNLVGKTVFFRISAEGQSIAGVVKQVDGSTAKVSLAIPNESGVLVLCKSSAVDVRLEDLTMVDAPILKDRDVKNWQSSREVEGLKKTEILDDNKNLIDHKDVKFSGYGSTFEKVTIEDRDGDYIMAGAFDKSLNEFRRNPVMLIDHNRSVNSMVGSYSDIRATDVGLELTGNMTNSKAAHAIHARALVAEKHLKTLSIGGIFFYKDDFKGIEEIQLYEISLVSVPANPDAEVQVRSIDSEFAEKAFHNHSKANGGEVRCKVSI